MKTTILQLWPVILLVILVELQGGQAQISSGKRGIKAAATILQERVQTTYVRMYCARNVCVSSVHSRQCRPFIAIYIQQCTLRRDYTCLRSFWLKCRDSYYPSYCVCMLPIQYICKEVSSGLWACIGPCSIGRPYETDRGNVYRLPCPKHLE